VKKHLRWGLCVALLLAGCQPLSLDKEKDLDPGDSTYYFLDPPKYAQTVKVEVKSPEPVAAAILKGDNEESALKALSDFAKGQKDAILAEKLGKGDKEYTIEASVPANTAYTVYIRNSGTKPAKVHVKIQGR
jgi:hypothetical protein